MTELTGRAFISYRRSRSDEIARLVGALHDHGVPTWQDIKDLQAEPTAEELRRVLGDPNAACGVPFITPEVAGSPTITKLELPKMLARHDKADGFFLQPIAAGGLDYEQAGQIASGHLGIDDLATWNIDRSPVDPIDEAEAARLADLILRRRIQELHARRANADPVTLRLFTRRRPGYVPGWWLSLDWCERFHERVANPGAWDDRLLPALRRAIDAISEHAPGRRIDACGQTSLAAAYALGAACPSPCGITLRWRQTRPGADDQWWSLGTGCETSAAEIRTRELDSSSQDLAVIVSVARPAEEAVAASAGLLPRFRGALRVQGPRGTLIDLPTPGRALELAQRIMTTVQEMREQWRDIRRIHLFLAAPAGLAMLLGQFANGLGPVQTYEHIPDDAVGHYEPAALVRA